MAIRRSDKWQRLGERLARTVVICRHIDTPYSPSLNSPFEVDFGGGSSDGGGAGSNF